MSTADQTKNVNKRRREDLEGIEGRRGIVEGEKRGYFVAENEPVETKAVSEGLRPSSRAIQEAVSERTSVTINRCLELLARLERIYKEGKVGREAYERLKGEYLTELKELGYDVSKIEGSRLRSKSGAY